MQKKPNTSTFEADKSQIAGHEEKTDSVKANMKPLGDELNKECIYFRFHLQKRFLVSVSDPEDFLFLILCVFLDCCSYWRCSVKRQSELMMDINSRFRHLIDVDLMISIPWNAEAIKHGVLHLTVSFSINIQLLLRATITRCTLYTCYYNTELR